MCKIAGINSSGVAIGNIIPHSITSIPQGFLACDGSAVSRSTYSSLFAVIGTNYGAGDGSTTFNLPDLRYSFMRGYGANISVTGSGSASSNNATFTSHSINRTGMKVRLSSGTLSGLSTGTDYFAIVVDANTLAFATSYTNAIAATKIAISGANSAVIVQFEDPDLSSRLQAAALGVTTGAGTRQADQMQGHKHPWVFFRGQATSWWDVRTYTASGDMANNGHGTNTAPDYSVNTNIGGAVDDGTGGTSRTGTETRPSNVYVNYIIAFK